MGEPAHMTIEQLEEFQATIEFIVNGKRVPCPKFAYVNGELKSGFCDISGRRSDSDGEFLYRGTAV